MAAILEPSECFLGENGPEGIGYTIANQFAESIDVEVALIRAHNPGQLNEMIREGHVHMAIGIANTRDNEKKLYLSRPYQDVNYQLVYKRGNLRPKNLEALDGLLVVNKGSEHEAILDSLRKEHTNLDWIAQENTDLHELLQKLNKGEIDYTIIQENDLFATQPLYPYIKPAFSLDAGHKIGFAFPRHLDKSLLDRINPLIDQLRNDGRLEELKEYYLSRDHSLNFVDRRNFWRQVERRLPVLKPYFMEASIETNTDWRLLAAVGYQESHWDKDAISPTGVKGIMMLTEAATKDLKIEDRNDPLQSILGGARYLQRIKQKIPERIKEPNRTWFALAGYNVGFGHLEDARILTQRQGGNPDLWQDVKQRLPLLKEEEYYSTLKNGYARGDEPVTYVENVKRFYDMLIWHTNNEKLRNASSRQIKS